MRLYFHEDEKVLPCILSVPGGGYTVVSLSEGEIVAKKFYETGYQTACYRGRTGIYVSGKQVTEYLPPCFLWQTAADELIPVRNSFLFA